MQLSGRSISKPLRRRGRLYALQFAAGILAIVAAAPGVRAAPPAADADWPCMVIKVPDLSLASVWSGPPIDAYLATWSADPEAAALARRVSQRRVSAAQAEQEIRRFGDAAGAHRRDRMLALMAGVFTTLAEERKSVMAGLDRYGRRQKELAADVRADLDNLRATQAAAAGQPGAPPAPQQPAALQQKVEWETRLFEQRRELLHAACGVPTLIEQRLFTLARIVQPLLG
jgi:hypothetical protein